MEVMVAREKKLSALAEPLVRYPQRLLNLCVREQDKERIVSDPNVLLAVRGVEEMLGGRGRVLLRASGTEPVIRVMAEAETEETCAKAVERVRDAIAGCGMLVEE